MAVRLDPFTNIVRVSWARTPWVISYSTGIVAPDAALIQAPPYSLVRLRLEDGTSCGGTNGNPLQWIKARRLFRRQGANHYLTLSTLSALSAFSETHQAGRVYTYPAAEHSQFGAVSGVLRHNVRSYSSPTGGPYCPMAPGTVTLNEFPFLIPEAGIGVEIDIFTTSPLYTNNTHVEWSFGVA